MIGTKRLTKNEDTPFGVLVWLVSPSLPGNQRHSVGG
jgi:hypothetical protein